MNQGIELLLGKTFTSIDKSLDEIIFKVSDTESYRMYHSQDCCEIVQIDDINGDLDDLIGSQILMSDERVSNDAQGGQKTYVDDSFTWTFYKLATKKGYVDIRWFGQSNGYYSQSVSVVKVGSKNDYSGY